MLDFDTDDILYEVLTGSAELTNALSGDIYAGDRPDGSQKEDITVNTLAIPYDRIQSAVSNVNIHVPDLKVRIGGKEQYKKNRERLRELASAVVSVLESARVPNLLFWVGNQTTLREREIRQHYVNLRIEWNIHNV
ncbi:MAG: hypothetical protein LBP50_09525 [Tannerella sp.]|jgi:hypothetical protein|nr:hypothetical protein [Tannerella sp.]